MYNLQKYHESHFLPFDVISRGLSAQSRISDLLRSHFSQTNSWSQKQHSYSCVFHPCFTSLNHLMLKVAVVSHLWVTFRWYAPGFVAKVWRRHRAMCSSVRRTKAPPWAPPLWQVLVRGCPAVAVCQCGRPVVARGFFDYHFGSVKKGPSVAEHIQPEAIWFKTTISWSLPTIHCGWRPLPLYVPEYSVWHEVLDEISKENLYIFVMKCLYIWYVCWSPLCHV